MITVCLTNTAKKPRKIELVTWHVQNWAITVVGKCVHDSAFVKVAHARKGIPSPLLLLLPVCRSRKIWKLLGYMTNPFQNHYNLQL